MYFAMLRPNERRVKCGYVMDKSAHGSRRHLRAVDIKAREFIRENAFICHWRGLYGGRGLRFTSISAFQIWHPVSFYDVVTDCHRPTTLYHGNQSMTSPHTKDNQCFINNTWWGWGVATQQGEMKSSYIVTLFVYSYSLLSRGGGILKGGGAGSEECLQFPFIFVYLYI